MIFLNIPALIMLAIAFGIGFGVSRVVGWQGEEPIMVIAGPLLFLMDLNYRAKHAESNKWYSPNAGGSLFFLPVFAFGALWIVLGFYYILSK